MHALAVSFVAQISLAFGMAGLFWPEKLLPIFDVLMFPWVSTHRTVRFNSIAALMLAVLLLAGLALRSV
jgi:hypothetical protein